NIAGDVDIAHLHGFELLEIRPENRTRMHLDIGIDVKFLLEDRGNAGDRLIGRVAGFPVESGDDSLVDLISGLGVDNRRGRESARDPHAVANDVAPRRAAPEYALHASPPKVSARLSPDLSGHNVRSGSRLCQARLVRTD